MGQCLPHFCHCAVYAIPRKNNPQQDIVIGDGKHARPGATIVVHDFNAMDTMQPPVNHDDLHAPRPELMASCALPVCAEHAIEF